VIPLRDKGECVTRADPVVTGIGTVRECQGDYKQNHENGTNEHTALHLGIPTTGLSYQVLYA
jgi:hypothetical protein